MPKAWSEVLANPEFQALGSDQRELARQEYFDSVVAPQIPAEQLDLARQEFDNTTAIDIPIAPAVVEQAAPVTEEPTFAGRIQGAFNARKANADELVNKYSTGVISMPEAILGGAAQGANAANDVAGAVIAEVTPDIVKEGLSNGIAYVKDSPVGAALGNAADKIGTAWNNFETAHPQAATNLQTAGNALNAGIGFVKLPGFKNSAAGATSKAVATANTRAGQAGSVVAKPLIAAAEKLNTKKVIPSAADLKGLAAQSYQKADSVGGVLKPEITNRFVDEVQNMRPQTSIGKTLGGDTAFTKMADKIEQIRNQPMSLQAAQEADELLGDAIDSEFQNGRLSKEGKRLLDIQSTLRNQIEQADPMQVVGGKEGFAALQDGRKFYSAAMKMSDVEKIVRRAENSQVPATAMKTGFRNLAEQARKRGYSADEIKAIDNAAKTGLATDALNILGSRLGTLINTGAGFAAAGPVGAGLAFGANQAMASTARAAASGLQKSRATEVSRAIADRAGVKGTGPRSEKLQKAFDSYKRKNP